MSETSAPPSGIGNFRVETSVDYRVLYSNLFRYRLGFHDFALTFSTVADSAGGKEPTAITDHVQIVMSMSQAKSLMEYLSLIVRVYERDIAPINAPGSEPPSEAEIENMIGPLRALGSH